ncbi:MAG: HlyD family secretion protein [Proteobacteria bacterium]|nr:HlyD family secretion protein [Pseudomonadota bacterium]
MAERDPQLAADLAGPGAPARWRRLALMVAGPVVLIGAALVYYLATDHYVSTDNAFIRQDKVSVSAELTGRIVAVGVRENQSVKAGDLLFRLDPEPYRIAVAQADAALAAADVKVVGMEADLSTKGADIATARSGLAYAQEQYNRTAALIQRGFATKAQMDAATQSLAAARGALSNAEGAAIKARAALATSSVAPGVNPTVLAAQAQKRQALYNLARTEVRAPVSGTVSQADRLLTGQLMLTGLPAVTIVVSDKSWVEANFKETDLSHMRVGQPAELWFDAYPGLRLKGHVASIGAGTGSEFSVLPAQNANGNWVKVTQRVPVRIAIDSPATRQLIAGLSTNVRVDTSR